MLSLKHLGRLETQDPYLGETLRSIQDAINQHGRTVGVDPTGVFPAPTAPAALSVTAVAGGFDVSITDANPQRGLAYYVEFDSDAGFGNARAVPLHTTRNVYLPLGNLTLFWRCYSQYQGSNQSAYTVFGSPTAVVGGGAITPVLQPTQGTGAGPGNGNNPFPPVGRGYGPLAKSPKLA